jgi:hypothetical protein
LWILGSLAVLSGFTCCTKKSTAHTPPVDLQVGVDVPFRFVAYGDTRFHDPRDTDAANPAVRVALVQAIAEIKPTCVCFTGDIVYNGYDTSDRKVRTARPPSPFQSKEINYESLLVEVDHDQLKVTMNRLELTTGRQCGRNPT